MKTRLSWCNPSLGLEGLSRLRPQQTRTSEVALAGFSMAPWQLVGMSTRAWSRREGISRRMYRMFFQAVKKYVALLRPTAGARQAGYVVSPTMIF